MLALLASFVCAAWVVIPLAAQEVIVMPSALFDLPDNPDQPDTPPTLLNFWPLRFPGELRSATEPSYAIYTQILDEKGMPPLDEDGRPYGWGISRMGLIQSKTNCRLADLRWTPALKNGVPVKSISWVGIIFNLASASEKNANATPRILKIAPVLYKRKQLAGFSEISLSIRATIEIDTTGAVKNLKLKTNTPFTRSMRPNIERSLAQWQFAPARKNGQPVVGRFTITFLLDQDPIEAEQERKRHDDEAPLKMPEIIERTDAIFPLGSAGMAGMVTVAFVIDTDGKARDIEIVSSTSDYLERPAMDAVRLWKFKPAIGKDGKPMKMRMQVPIRFNSR